MTISRTAYAIEIDLTSQTVATDATIGLDSGVIRFITGRSSLDGSNSLLPLTYEDGSSVTGTFYEDFITKNGVGKASSRIDITESGNYGNLSSFNFSVRNNTKYYKLISDLGLNLVGSSVTLYTMYGTVLYPRWTGVVSNQPYNETSFTFQCIDNVLSKHKTIPPNVTSATEFPNIDDENIGKVIPVPIGDIPYHTAPIVDTVYEPQTVISRTSDGLTNSSTTTYLENFYRDSEGKIRVAIKTDALLITEDQWADGTYYFRVSIDHAGNTDDSEMVEITANTAYAGNNRTTLTLARIPRKLDRSYAASLYGKTETINMDVTGGTDERYIVFPGNFGQLPSTSVLVQVVRMPARFPLATNTISEIVAAENGSPLTFLWNSSTTEYEKYTGISVIQRTTLDTGEDFIYPNIGVLGGVSTADGSVESIDHFVLPKVYWLGKLSTNAGPKRPSWGNDEEFDGGVDITEDVTDRTGASSYTIISTETITPAGNDYEDVTAFEITLPDDIDPTAYDSVHLGIDWAAIGGSNIPSWPLPALNVNMTTGIFGVYPGANGALYTTSDGLTWAYREDGNTYILQNMIGIFGERSEVYDKAADITFVNRTIPEGYYTTDVSPVGRKWASDISDIGTFLVDTKGVLTLSNFEKFATYDPGTKRVLLLMTHRSETNADPSTTLANGIVIYGVSVFGIRKNKLFTDARFRISGELVDGNKTNNVYRAFQHILETYDGIDSSLIDYGNLSSARANWHVGRTLDTQKSSYEYIKELCKHSFVTFTTKRNGDKRLSAFLDDVTSTYDFTSSNMIRGSIKGAEKTSLSKLYNEFVINFSSNPDSSGYDSTLSITNVDEDSFPLSTDNTWKTYVGGIDSYADAKAVWDVCHGSYLENGAITTAPESLSNLDWFVDKTIFDSSEIGGVYNSAWKYLDLFSGWSSKQKDLFSCSVPISSSTLSLEVMDRITFTDTIYTGSVTRDGYIVKMETNAKSESIDFQLLLVPENLEFSTGNLIIETGSNTDTIVESGSQVDTIIEGQ